MNGVNDVLAVLDDRLAAASPDVLRSLIKGFAEALMSAEATRCAARVTANAATPG